MQINIPRAGLYHLYFPFWEAFFQALGVDIVLSPKTDKNILMNGLRVANSEMCLPMKIMYAHVLALKDNGNPILLPQMDEVKTEGQPEFFCPFFVGLSDVMQAEFPELKILRPKMIFQNGEIVKEPWIELAQESGFSKEQGERACKEGLEKQKHFVFQMEKEEKLPLEILEGRKINPETEKSVALIGRPYLLYDEYSSLDLVKKIINKGYKIRTWETVSAKDSQEAFKKMPESFHYHWHLTNRECGAILHLCQDPSIRGIIYVTPFNCGPDFLIEEFVLREIRKTKPVTMISLDESSGEAGLDTRLDAFFDII
ncbi:MAG: acyl-CoA dehydratase activase-related protein [Patescibacteria group bacterium]